MIYFHAKPSITENAEENAPTIQGIEEVVIRRQHPVNKRSKLLTKGHEFAFKHTARYVEDILIKGHQVVQLSSLRLIYVAGLNKTWFPNTYYRAEMLKKKLEKHCVLGQKLVFTKMDVQRSLSFYLIYSSDITTEEAVKQAYQLASKDTVKHVALILRSIITRSFKESTELPWPPSESDLEVGDGCPLFCNVS
jgi:hypothetical protein